MSDLVGKTLGHYRILDRLGFGGMGEVLLAEDTRLGRRIALKLLPARLAEDERRLVRFEREARALAALNHPGIVTIHSVEEVDGLLFLTMELVEGKLLSDRIPPQGLALHEFLSIALPLVEALAAAHRNGIIHRDLKPGNIMMTPDNRLKILDFGLARLQRSGSGDDFGTEDLTREGEFVGTLGYAPPEVLESKPQDERSDLFSVGMILYTMATGHSPFHGDNPGALVCSILNHTPAAPSTHNPGIPPALDAIIIRCLEKDPARRYASAETLHDDLMALYSGTLPDGVIGIPPSLRKGWRPLWRWAVLGFLVIAGLLTGVLLILGGKGGEGKRSKIVVFPFENLGPAEDAYFADGLTEELTGKLAAAGDLAVISRTSAVQYNRQGKTMKDIGRDLGVDYVLEGSVRWDRSGSKHVVVTPQLIRVADDTHVWAARFELVMEDIFAIQAEIADEVLRRLDIALAVGGKAKSAARPTGNLDAYQAYLRGLSYSRGFLENDLRLAVDMFTRAVELDPSFALAYAKLGYAHAGLFQYRYDLSEERLKKARAAAVRSLELEPGLSEGHRAMGYIHYWGYRDYPRALEELGIAARERPNDSQLLADISFIRRRQGLFQEALENLGKALELDPWNEHLTVNLALTYRVMRRYEESDRMYRQSIALAPDHLLAYGGQAVNYWMWDGTAARARKVLAAMPRQEDPYALLHWQFQLLYERRYQELLDRLASSGTELMADQIWYYPRPLVECFCYLKLGQPVQARRCGESARTVLEAAVRDHPGDARLHCALGWAYALLGRPVDALREGNQAVRICPVERDTMEGPAFEQDLAKICAWSGQPGKALDHLEHLLTIPGNLSQGMLRLDPAWEPLANQPRFKQLLRNGMPEPSNR